MYLRHAQRHKPVGLKNSNALLIKQSIYTTSSLSNGPQTGATIVFE